MTRREFLALSAAAAGASCGNLVVRGGGLFMPGPRSAPLLVGLNGAFYGAALPMDTYQRIASFSDVGRGTLLRVPVRSALEAQRACLMASDYPALRVLLLVERPELGLVDVVADAARAQAIGFASAWGLELVNEPNLDTPGFTAMTPAAFGQFIADARRTARLAGFTGHVVSGGIWNTDLEGLRDFLAPARAIWMADQARTGELADTVLVGLHWYGDAGADVKGLVQQYLGDAPCLITEFGQPARYSAGEQAQAAYYDEQLAAFASLPSCVGAIGYQLAMGPTDTDLDRFGVQRLDGTWRPAADILAAWGHR